MSVPDNFTRLKEQVETADGRIRAAAAKDQAELKAMVDEARVNADQRAAELRTKADEAGDQAERHWHEVRVDWDNHVRRIRERIDATKAADDADAAEFEAEWAAADAADAVEFAAAAAEEAEYAVLDAVKARRRADAMAAAT